VPTLLVAFNGLGGFMTSLSTIGQNDRETLLDGLALLARIFWGPEASLCQDLCGYAQESLSRLTNLLSPPGPAAARELGNYLIPYDDPAELCARLEPAYVRLFVSDQGGVVAPLYHSCYQGEGLLMGPPAQEMARRLEAAGLSLEDESAEPPDHLAVELEYLILLLEDGWSHDDPALLNETGEFAGNFMLPWTEAFLARLAGETDSRFYPLAAELLTALLAHLGRP
jgi:TorA maturation chaperone TorD